MFEEVLAGGRIMANFKPPLLISHALINETLATAPVQGKRLLDPLRSFTKGVAPFNILEDVNVSNDAEVHRYEADLWGCLEGEVTFVVGGALVNPWAEKLADGTENTRELKAKEIRDGTELVLKPGDWLYIPAGQPHSHRGTGRLIIIKIPEPEVPLGDVPGWEAY